MNNLSNENNQLKNITVTKILIAINVLIFFYTDLFATNLVDKGAIYWPDIITKAKYYQLLTHMFLHGSASHLFSNMISLYLVGEGVEKIVGKIKYLGIYFTTGILASVFSGIIESRYSNPVPSIGASGAIFGIFGFLAAMLFIHRKLAGDNTAFRIILVIVLMAFSSMEPGVDWLAHLGGGLSGIVLALLFYHPKR